MSELFDIPETLSPRLAWMKNMGITTTTITPMSGDPKNYPKFLAKHTIIEAGESEDEAVLKLAKRMGIKLWNEL